MMCSLPLPLSAALVQARLWQRADGWEVMGSEDAKSQGCRGGGQMGSPSSLLCNTVPCQESACFHRMSLLLNRKGSPCSPTCFQSRSLQKAQRNLAEPPLSGHKPCRNFGQWKFFGQDFAAPVPPPGSPSLLPSLSSVVTTMAAQAISFTSQQSTQHSLCPAPAASLLSK